MATGTVQTLATLVSDFQPNTSGLITPQMQLDFLATVFPPTGTIYPYFGSASPNSGWLLTDGTNYPTASYPLLATALSFTLVGTLNSNTTVNSISSTQTLFPGMALQGTGIPAPISFTGNITSNSFTMGSLSTTTGLASGDIIFGPGLPSTGVQINTINTGASTLTMRRFEQPVMYTSTSSQSPASSALNFYATSSLFTQSYYAVCGIKTIASSTSITISQSATLSSSQTLTFYPCGGGYNSSFSVPDTRGRVLYGAGYSLPTNAQAGIISSYPTHVPLGLYSDILANSNAATIGTPLDSVATGSDFQVPDQTCSITVTTTETWPAFLACNFIIKT